MAAEFADLGVKVEATEDEEEVFEIWDINAAVFEAFLALETQWRIVPLVGIGFARLVHTGLDYGAVDIVLRRHGLDNRSAFDDIRSMEQAVLDAHAEAAR